MKLYVWTEFAPDYTDGLAFAIAESEAEARNLIVQACEEPYMWGPVQVFEIDKPIAFGRLGGS